MKKLNKELISRKPNKIIEARQGLSILQHRILFNVFAKFETKVANTKVENIKDYVDLIKTTYEIKLSDIIPEIRKLKVGEESALYKYIDKESLLMQKQIHEIQTDGGWKRYTIIDFVEFHKKEMKLEIKIADSMITIILDWFRNGFTQIPVKEIVPLRSKYSIRIFELLLRVMNIPGVKEDGYIISYNELRKKLGIPEKEYERFYHFNNRILRQAQKEILEKTFMRFGYKKEKEFGTKKLNICFFDITHNVKEVLPQQIQLFDSKEDEKENDEKVKENSKSILNWKEERERKIKEMEEKDDDHQMTDKEFQRMLDDISGRALTTRQYNEVFYDEDNYYNIEEDIIEFNEQEREIKNKTNQKFTGEQNEKLDKYLEGIFSADEIKLDYEFDYIEFYYKRAMELYETGNVKNFQNFYYNLMKKDKHKYYELKEKEKQKKEAEEKQKKAREEVKKREQQKMKRKKEEEEKKYRRLEEIFDSIPDDVREELLNELYKKNPLYKSDNAEVRKIIKWVIAETYEKKQ